RDFTFIIKVLAYDRISSLSRCLNSLSRAHYDVGDKVHLHVFIDHFRLDYGTPSAVTDQSLNTSNEILDFVDMFDWAFGEKVVHYRTSNVGLQAQWLESWWPSSNHEFAFVVEDDMEVSPLYYRFLKALILNYYYNSSNSSPKVYGASLQRPRFVPGKHGNEINLDVESRIFLYQLVGTWGQLLFPGPWKEFRRWYDVRKAKNMKPILDGMITTRWYKRMGERIWTPWFIKFIHSSGYFNLYTNFHNSTALSISHREAGVSNRAMSGPDSDLMMDGNSIGSDLLELPPLDNLKWYDFCFREVLTNRFIGSLNDLGSVIQSLQKDGSILFLSLYRAHVKGIRNILCHFERLNIRNYILIGPSSDFLIDLSRRGHAVIDAAQFYYDTKSLNLRDSNIERIEEIVVKAYAIKKSLELSLNTLFLDGHLLPLYNDSFFDILGRSGDDFYIGKSSGILYTRGSTSVSKIWSAELIHSFASDVNGESVSRDHLFLYGVEKFLEKKHNVKVKNIDEMKLGFEIGSYNVSMTKSLENTVRFVYWSYGRTDIDTIQKGLEHFGLWVVDADSSCTAVFCHGT
ncbi:hypothetical protein M569_04597, partial [Genlisea aurea]